VSDWKIKERRLIDHLLLPSTLLTLDKDKLSVEFRELV
jgi:hypothetical protein